MHNLKHVFWSCFQTVWFVFWNVIAQWQNSDLQGSRVSSYLDPNPGMTPPLHDVDPELLWEISVWLVTPCSGVDPGTFDWGGSKLWFRKDCWTFLWQITSNRYDHFLWYVNRGRLWHWKYCFASRGEQIIQGYPKTKLHFWISLEFSLVAKCNARFIKKNHPFEKWYSILSM